MLYPINSLANLRIGTISAFFHGSGKVLKVKKLLIRLVIMGAITGELSFRILVLTYHHLELDLKVDCVNGLKCKYFGVLFGHELRSDSHGSNPSES